MTDALSLVEKHLYQKLFLHELNWSAPDSPPISYTADDGQTYTAINVSSYKGLRVWVCDKKPGSKVEAELDRLIAKTTTDRLVIFHNDDEQVWRWPARRTKDNSTSTRLTSHRHRSGSANPKFEYRLDIIRLPIDVVLDANTVLTKVRDAFDVEARNESKRASKLMARMYAALESAYPAGYDIKKRDHEISVTLARILFLMFGDDTEMWETDAFLDFIHYQTPADATTLGQQLTELFDALDAPGGGAAHGLSTSLPYINGGLFREKITLPKLGQDFRDAVLDACAVDWSTVSPAIFGSMFQSVRDAQTRRELGEHYTSEENILKTLNPLFLDELRAEFDRARTMKNEKLILERLWARLGDIRFMDPACGCGNFIIVAFRELRDLELRIMERLQEITGVSQLALDPTLGVKVSLDHFYGIEIDEWPARIAETAMFLVDRQCDLKLKERFGEAPQRLPIQTQATIIAGNALALDWRTVVAPSTDVVLAGNPPFIGQKERSAAQTQELRAVWGADYNGNLDYVSAWFRKASEYLGTEGSRFAFVATSSVCQGQSVAPMWEPLLHAGWRIQFAHRPFDWVSEATGAAGVHVVVVGMRRGALEQDCRLFLYADNGQGEAREVRARNINPYLLNGPDVAVKASRKPVSKHLPSMTEGSKLWDFGSLVVKPVEIDAFRADPVAAKYLRPLLSNTTMLKGQKRWVLWLVDSTESERSSSELIRERIAEVQRKRAESSDAEANKKAATPHLFTNDRQPKGHYLAIPKVTGHTRTYLPVAYASPEVIVNNTLFTAADTDGFIFAVVSSRVFTVWQRLAGGHTRADSNFSNTLVWNTFPLTSVDAAKRGRAIDAGREILRIRATYKDASLENLYGSDRMPSDLREAHRALDHVIESCLSIEADDLARCQSGLLAKYKNMVVKP